MSLKEAHSCAMHSSNLIYLICVYTEQKSHECCHDNRISGVSIRPAHTHKKLELPKKQGDMATKYIHVEEIISHTRKNVFLLSYLSYDIVMPCHHNINEKEQG